MIGFNELGKYGRLGNQMFQYAALRGIAAYHNYEFCIPHANHQLLDTFKLVNNQRIAEITPFNKKNFTYKIKTLDYDENYVKNCPDWVTILGYFQSEKYFKHIENSIREDFNFKTNIKTICYKKIKEFNNPVALHIRRTDYLNNSDIYYKCDLNYYKNALSNFNSSQDVIIFSDDPEWCKNQKLFSSDRFFISEQNDHTADLCLMSMCNDFIIANSSFSWWGAWLANRGTVIAPSFWFKETYASSKDLVPDIWIQI